MCTFKWTHRILDSMNRKWLIKFCASTKVFVTYEKTMILLNAFWEIRWFVWRSYADPNLSVIAIPNYINIHLYLYDLPRGHKTLFATFRPTLWRYETSVKAETKRTFSTIKSCKNFVGMYYYDLLSIYANTYF